MEETTEHILIKNTIKGDVQSFKKIVISYNMMVYTLAYRVLKNREEAEEVTQDVFLKVYQSLHSFNMKSKLSTWIYRITYNSSINKVKSQKRQFETTEISRDNEYSVYISDDTQNTISDEENRKTINGAILKLPEVDRIIITLYYYEELSVKEIADIISISAQNVKIKLYRSRKKWLKKLHWNSLEIILCLY